jgi:hypothetical protein
MHTEFWLGSFKEREHLKIPCVDGRIILECFIRKDVGRVWIGFIRLRIGIHGRLL